MKTVAHDTRPPLRVLAALLTTALFFVGCVAIDEDARAERHRRTLSVRDVTDGGAGLGDGPVVPSNVNLAASRQGLPSTIPMSMPASRASAGAGVQAPGVNPVVPAGESSTAIGNTNHGTPQNPASKPSSSSAAQSNPNREDDPLASMPQDTIAAVQRLGPQVLFRPDGRITKFFPVRAERGKFLQDLASRYVGIPIAQIELIAGADVQETRVNPYQQPGAPTRVPISDWLVVTGAIEEIERFERFVNLYFSSVPQIEIEARIAEVTTSDLVDIGVKPTDPLKPMFSVDGMKFVKSLNSIFPNASAASEGLLSLQAVQSPVEFQATLELLSTRRDIDIISTPRIAVRNGGRAEIVNGNDIPYAEITTVVGGVPTSTIRYKQTGVKLYVTPYLAGSDTVLLSLEVELSIPTSVTETFVASAPIIATRSAKTDVHISDGNTFVIGGLITTNNLEQVSKIPILGDIPILGLLFRSTLTQKQYTEVLFFITPHVVRDPGSQGLVIPNSVP